MAADLDLDVGTGEVEFLEGGTGRDRGEGDVDGGAVCAREGEV